MVGCKVCVIVEKRFRRPVLIECMLDSRESLVRYHQAADELNRGRAVKGCSVVP
jgi:hypothetical protein